MGSGFSFSSRPSSPESEDGWGDEQLQERDEDLFQPIRNYSGEVVGWRERSDSEKLKRKAATMEIITEENEDDDIEVVDNKVVIEPNLLLDDEEEKRNAFNESGNSISATKLVLKENIEDEINAESDQDREPSAKSIDISKLPAQQRKGKEKYEFKTNPHYNEFNKEAAAAKLYKALKSFDTDEEAIISVLANHSWSQRLLIEKTYNHNHKKVKTWEAFS